MDTSLKTVLWEVKTVFLTAVVFLDKLLNGMILSWLLFVLLCLLHLQVLQLSDDEIELII